MHANCSASAFNRKQVVVQPPLGDKARLELRPPPLHASRSAIGVATSELQLALESMEEFREAGTKTVATTLWTTVGKTFFSGSNLQLCSSFPGDIASQK